jgi:nucleoside-diphosphate-sugar epimerase
LCENQACSLPAYPFAICHVDNVIEAVQCALERGTGGRAYFIKDRETTTFRDFIGMLADMQGLSTGGLKSVSYRLAFTIGWLMEVGAAIRVFQRRPVFVAYNGADDRAGIYC